MFIHLELKIESFGTQPTKPIVGTSESLLNTTQECCCWCWLREAVDEDDHFVLNFCCWNGCAQAGDAVSNAAKSVADTVNPNKSS